VFCVAISGLEMSSYVRCYAKYLNEKLCAFRVMSYDFCKVKRGLVHVPFGLWAWMGRSNRVGWWSIGAKRRCHGNQFWDAICCKWLWRLMGYNFGSMTASDTQFDSRDGFSRSSYPMKT